MFSLRVFHNNRIDELFNDFSFNEANHLASCLNHAINSCLNSCDDFLEFDPPFYFFIEKVIGGTTYEG